MADVEFENLTPSEEQAFLAWAEEQAQQGAEEWDLDAEDDE